jgi:hypothetical protein
MTTRPADAALRAAVDVDPARDGLVYALPEDGPDGYHAGPELSSSGMKLLIKAPRKFQHEQAHRTNKREFDLGHVVHGEVLGTGLDVVVVQTTAKDGTKSDAEDYKTPSARAHRNEVREAGGVPILRHELVKARAMAREVLAHPDARRELEVPADPEVSAFVTIDGVRVRARFDALHRDRPRIVDLKTGQTADPLRWPHRVADLGYDLQGALYGDVLAMALGLDNPDDVSFIHIAVESEAPHLVAVHELAWEYIERGRTLYGHAVELYRALVESGLDVWPGYPTGIHQTRPPEYLRTPAPPVLVHGLA